MPPTNLELFQTYKRLKSVYRVGKIFGISHSTVHRRLQKLEFYQPKQPEFTEAQINRIKEYYATAPDSDFDLDALAAELGKLKHNVCRKARKLGISNQNRPINTKTRIKAQRPKWHNRPHPRGMSGKKHSEKSRKLFSVLSKERWVVWKEQGTGCMAPEARKAISSRMRLEQAKNRTRKNYTWAAGGHREDLGGVYFRSAWEANYARYLNLLMKMGVVKSWAFESETFWFENIRRGVRSFLIDFKVQYVSEERPVYVEIKGYMDKRSKTKISRFRKYYPQHRLEVIGSKEYYSMRNRWSSAIPNWEFPKKRGAAG